MARQVRSSLYALSVERAQVAEHYPTASGRLDGDCALGTAFCDEKARIGSSAPARRSATRGLLPERPVPDNLGDLNDFALTSGSFERVTERGADGNDVLHSTVFGEVFRSATPAMTRRLTPSRSLRPTWWMPLGSFEAPRGGL
jgi:hypothetical protein